MNKEIKQNIIQILDQFKIEEVGNKLSQFSMMALRSMIVAELNKLKDEQPTS